MSMNLAVVELSMSYWCYCKLIIIMDESDTIIT